MDAKKKPAPKAPPPKAAKPAPEPKQIETCAEFVNTNGDLCGKPCVAKGQCARHYKQARRGRLGKTKAIAAAGEGDEVTVRCPRDLKKAVKAQAKSEKRDASEVWRDAVKAYLVAHPLAVVAA